MPGTINVRMSAVGTLGPPWRMPPAPEGTLDQADRQEIVGSYAGIAAGGDVSGAVAFSGSGSFALAGTVTAFGSIAFAGAGDFALAGSVTSASAIAFSGSGSFALAGTATAFGAIAFAGASAFALDGSATIFGAVAFAGAGDFALAGSATRFGGVAFAGAGDFALAGTAREPGEVAGGSVFGSAVFGFGIGGAFDVQPYLGETIVLDLPPTHDPATGSVSDADGTPVCKVFEDAIDSAILTPSVVKRTGETGDYRVSIACTEGNGFEAGKSYNVVASATVGGVSAKVKLATFQIREDASPAGFLSALVPIRNQDDVTAPTLGDALLGAWCEAFGREFISGKSQVKRRPDSSAPVRTFTLNSATNPTSRS